MYRSVIALASLWAADSGIAATNVLGSQQRSEPGLYIWSFTWTGESSCPVWPCHYSYELSGPQYSNANVSISPFRASCAGIVDQPLKPCDLSEVAVAVAAAVVALEEDYSSPPLISGNLSTYETSGVGPGLAAIAMTWFSDEYSRNLTLTGSTPLQVNEENDGTWDVYPEGCPISSSCSNVG